MCHEVDQVTGGGEDVSYAGMKQNKQNEGKRKKEEKEDYARTPTFVQ